MPGVPASTEAATAVVSWNAFAAEGAKRIAEAEAREAVLNQLYPPGKPVNAPHPRPVYFFGPGPDGRVHHSDPPVGTLHFARWRHELSGVEDPGGGGYYHEENPMMINSRRVRPAYTTKRNQPAREVNHFRWEKVTADSMKSVRTFPGTNTTRALHDEYLLNEDDFNERDTKEPKIAMNLDNRQDEDLKNIYPIGYKLIKQRSKVNGYAEWEEGHCLGTNPHSPDGLTRHIGWQAGLGADPQDAHWKDIFHGNLAVKPVGNFVPPKETWSKDPSKVTVLTSPDNPYMTLPVRSLKALKAGLPPPAPDTLDARNAWLDAQAPHRCSDRAQQDALMRDVMHVGPWMRYHDG
ncbi:hypothetical protein F4802DRAFT_594303 [Xylaria palmicola]|nr:hypothetical protein F4802DRAFT_594303 [Xylaria palmicola]